MGSILLVSVPKACGPGLRVCLDLSRHTELTAGQILEHRAYTAPNSHKTTILLP